MSKYRVKYSRNEFAKYISHLDFMRCMVRTFRRAEIPVKYSQGFNPHMVMTIGLPMSVGVTSDGEYLDVELHTDIPTEKFIEDVNKNIPLGLKVVDVNIIDKTAPPLSDIDSAIYMVKIFGAEKIDTDKLLSLPEIVVPKKTKKGINDTDIKKDIRSIEFIKNGENYVMYRMHLSAGGRSNLKPETVTSAMEKYLGMTYEGIEVHREELLFLEK